MRSVPASLLSGGAAAALVLTASTVFAHIDLLDPPSRYTVNRANGGGGSKSCPCGGPENVIDPNRICDVPAEQARDPNRSTRVSTFEAGEKITISVAEYIDHSGRFRVAFDSDSADMTDFNSNILLDVPDDATRRGSATAAPYTFEVTLPNMTCENCTLQVIQDMNGNTTTPVADPSPDSTYYSCADIRLVPAGTMGDDEGEDPDETPASGGSGGVGNTPPPANNGGTSSTNGTASGNNTGTNLGTLPMMGDNSSPTASSPNNGGTPTTNNPMSGVGSLMPGMNTGTSNPLRPADGAPIVPGTSNSESSGGCSLGTSGSRAPVSPFAALAVAGMATTLLARRRVRRQK